MGRSTYLTEEDSLGSARSGNIGVGWNWRMKDEMCWKFCKRVESGFASRAYSWCFDIWHVRQKILHKAMFITKMDFPSFKFAVLIHSCGRLKILTKIPNNLLNLSSFLLDILSYRIGFGWKWESSEFWLICCKLWLFVGTNGQVLGPGSCKNLYSSIGSYNCPCKCKMLNNHSGT